MGAEVELKVGMTARTADGQGRVAYRPDWSESQPWVSYWNGTAGQHFETLEQARAYFVRHHRAGLGVLK